MSVTQSVLRRHLEYNPETGLFHWLVVNSNFVKIGQQAGSLQKTVYIQLNVLNQKLYAHRMAFLYMEDREPMMIDHINHCRSDNRWENLRESSPSLNSANRSPVPSKTGYRGVDEMKGRFYARIKLNYKCVRLGGFATAEEAAIAFDNRAELEWGEHYVRQVV
mgnify:CR=1 FL=1